MWYSKASVCMMEPVIFWLCKSFKQIHVHTHHSEVCVHWKHSMICLARGKVSWLFTYYFKMFCSCDWFIGLAADGFVLLLFVCVLHSLYLCTSVEIVNTHCHKIIKKHKFWCLNEYQVLQVLYHHDIYDTVLQGV